MPADPSRKPPAWRNQAAGGERKQAAQPAWRKDKTAAQPGRRRLSRRAQLGIAGGLLVALTVGFVLLVRWLYPPKPAGILVIGAGYEENLSLPHNAYGWRAARDLLNWCGSGNQGDSWFSRMMLATVIHRQEPDAIHLVSKTDWAPDKWKGFKEQTLIVFVAADGGADDKGPYLFLDDPALLDDPNKPRRLDVADMIASLKPITDAGKNVVLVLDATGMTAHWPSGMLHNAFAEKLAELEPRIKGQGGRLVVLSASGPDQRSWTSEEWGQTVFTHYLIEGLQGGARDASGTVTAASLFKYVRDKVQDWAVQNRVARQEPVLLPSDGGRAQQMMLVVGTPKPAADQEEKPAAAFPEADLLAAWQKHKDLEQTRPADYAPTLWRLYEATLLRYEQVLRAGDPDGHAQNLKSRLGDLDAAIRTQSQPALSSRGKTLAWGNLAATSTGGADTGDLLKKRWLDRPVKELQTAWKAVKESRSSEATDALRLALDRRLLQEVEEKKADPKDVQKAHQLLLVLDGGRNDRPVEDHLLALLGRDLDERGTSQKPTPAADLLLGLTTCAEAEATALSTRELKFPGTTDTVPAYSAFVYPWIADSVRKGDAERRQGENLLFASDEDSWKSAREHLEKARADYQAARDEAEGVREALAVYHETRAWLPAYARYVADRPRSTEQDLAAVVKLAGMVDRLSAELNASTRPPASLKRDAEDAHKQLEALQEGFRSWCRQMATEGPQAANQSRWHELEAVLTVSSIEPELRKELIDKSRQISRDLWQKTAQGGRGDAKDVHEELPLAAERRQGQMALAVLGDTWVHECIRSKEAADRLQDKVKGDQAALDDAGRRIGECWQAMYTQVKEDTRMTSEDGDRAKEREAIVRAARLSRKLDPGAASLVREVLQTDPVAERHHLLLSELLQGMADRALLDYWWYEKDTTPYYVVTGKSYVTDARKQDLSRHLALKAERTKQLNDLWNKLVPVPLQVTIAEGRVPVTDQPGIDPKFVMSDLRGLPEVPRGQMVCWLQATGPVVVPGGERQVRKIGQATIPYPLKWRDGAIPTKECEVTLNVRYRGQEINPTVVIEPVLNRDILVSHLPPYPRGRIMVQADNDLYQKLAWEQMHIAIVFDNSYSMEMPLGPQGNQPNPKIPEATAALRQVLRTLPPGPKVSLWTFGYREWDVNNGFTTEPIERLQRPKPWSQSQTDDLVNAVNRPNRLPNAGSPIVRGMLKAAEADLGLGKRESSTENQGAKLLLVLTDGDDNRFSIDPDYNPQGYRTRGREGRKIPTYLKQRFGNTDIRVIVIGFRVDEGERASAEKQFQGVKKFRQPGDFILADDKEELVRALKKALRDQQLLCRIQPADQDSSPESADDAKREIPVRRWGRENLSPSGPLKPGRYIVSVPVVPPQEVLVKAGDQLLLKVERSGLERALLKNFDELDRRALDGLPSGEDQKWLVTVHGNNARPDDPRVRDLLISTDKDDARRAPNGLLRQVRPGFVWFEVRPQGTKEVPKSLSWRNVGDVQGYPAPMFRLTAEGWPRDALPQVAAWVCDGDPSQDSRFSSRIWTHNAGTDPEKDLAGSRDVGTDQVKDVSITFETQKILDADGQLVPKSCLVVRARYSGKDPVIARISGLGTEGEEHRFYSSAHLYTGVFWTADKTSARETPFDVTLVSVKAVKNDTGTAKVRFNLQEAHRDLFDLQPVGWGGR